MRAVENSMSITCIPFEAPKQANPNHFLLGIFQKFSRSTEIFLGQISHKIYKNNQQKNLNEKWARGKIYPVFCIGSKICMVEKGSNRVKYGFRILLFSV